jgi:hypothetical protein
VAAANRRPLWKALLVMGALLVPAWGTAPAGAATVRFGDDHIAGGAGHDVIVNVADRRGAGSALRGVDLPGQDYRNFSARSYRKCNRTCSNEAQCKAWTFVAPGTPGAHGVCWLKHAVPPQQPNARTTSGTKSQTRSESLVLTPGPGTAGRLPRGERTSVTTRDHRRSRAPAESTELACDNGRTYKLSTGNEGGICTVIKECSFYVKENECGGWVKSAVCDDNGREPNSAEATCGLGCTGSSGSGTCESTPSG